MGAVLARAGVGVAEAIASWAAKASPAVMARVLPAVSKAGSVVLTSGTQLIAYVKSNPGKAALAAATIADLGVNIYEMFGSSPNAVAVDELDGMLDKDADVQLVLGSSSDLELARKLVRFVRRLGANSPEEMISYHRMLRLFTEVNTATVTKIATEHWSNGRFGA